MTESKATAAERKATMRAAKHIILDALAERKLTLTEIAELAAPIITERESRSLIMRLVRQEIVWASDAPRRDEPTRYATWDVMRAQSRERERLAVTTGRRALVNHGRSAHGYITGRSV